MPTKEEVEKQLRQIRTEKEQLQRKYERVKAKLAMASVIISKVSDYISSDSDAGEFLDIQGN